MWIQEKYLKYWLGGFVHHFRKDARIHSGMEGFGPAFFSHFAHSFAVHLWIALGLGQSERFQFCCQSSDIIICFRGGHGFFSTGWKNKKITVQSTRLDIISKKFKFKVILIRTDKKDWKITFKCWIFVLMFQCAVTNVNNSDGESLWLWVSALAIDRRHWCPRRSLGVKGF